MHYPPFSAMANLLVRSEKQEEALRLSAELGQPLTPAPEKMKVMGPAEALRAAPEERVSLSVADQVGQPQGAE
jgi:primosomal protein N'